MAVSNSFGAAAIGLINFEGKTTIKAVRMASTGSSLAPTPPPKGGVPDTLESRVSFRMHSAALCEPAKPQSVDPRVVLVTAADGALVVYPPSRKLAILAEERAKRAATPAND
jgi:hypothetical protein